MNIITRPCPHGKTHNTNAEIILRSRNTLGPKRDPKQSISPQYATIVENGESKQISDDFCDPSFAAPFCFDLFLWGDPPQSAWHGRTRRQWGKRRPARYSKAGVSPLLVDTPCMVCTADVSQGASFFMRKNHLHLFVVDVSLPTFARWHCGRFWGKKVISKLHTPPED